MVWQILVAVIVVAAMVAVPSWALHRAARWLLRRGWGVTARPLVTAIPSTIMVIASLALLYGTWLAPNIGGAPAPRLPPLAGAPSPVPAAPPPPPREGSAAQAVPAPSAPPAGGEFADVDTALKNLVISRGEYVAPDAMEIGRPQPVTLELGPAQQVLDDISRLKSERGGQAGGGDVPTAPLMRAQLTGVGFDVDPKDGVDQWVSLASPTTWTWQVTPVDGEDWFPRFSTKRALNVALSAVLNIQGAEHPRVIKTWEKTITVAVGWPDWLHKAVDVGKDVWWAWLLLVAIAGYVLHRKPWPKVETE